MSDSEKNIAGEEHSASGTNAESLAFSEEERAATAESMAHLDAVLTDARGIKSNRRIPSETILPRKCLS